MLKKTIFLLMVLAFSWLVSGAEGKTDIHKAAGLGDVAAVETALRANPGQVNAFNDAGLTPLHLAAQKGQAAMVAKLIKSGADVSLPSTKDKRYPLHFAAMSDAAVVQMLVEAGADVNCRETDNETPLYYAAYYGRLEIVRYLLEKGASLKGEYTKINTSPLGYAINRNHVEIVKFLVEKGAELNANNPDNFTCLHQASFAGGAELIGFLAEKGLDVNARMKKSLNTPLSLAVERGNIEGVKALLKHGAAVDNADANGRTPLHDAAFIADPTILTLLLGHKTQLNARENIHGYTPLHAAALNGRTEAVKLLIEKGADINAADNRQRTPIQLAARYGHAHAAKLLKTAGAAADLKEKNFGPSPILAKELKPGAAAVWYLGHSGWAIKTQNHLLIFDYFQPDKPSQEPLLANGHITPEELKTLNVTVFVSHDHGDHYTPAIFEWKKTIPRIAYVTGFAPKGIDPALYVMVKPREQKTVNGLKIAAISSTDAGVGFHVGADGVGVFHPGDHADKGGAVTPTFNAEIDFLASQNLKTDLQFAPVSGCGFGDLCSVRNGAYYTAAQLRPKALFPMHALFNEQTYKTFADEAKTKNIPCAIGAAEHRGDHFFFTGDTLKFL